MKNKLITALLILMLVIGIFLVLLNPIQHYYMKKLSSDLQQISAEEIEKNDALDASFDFNEAQTLSVFDVLNAQLNRKDLAVLGSIVVPSVNMQLPIVKGVSTYALAVGAGTMKPTQKMGEGNYALASHYFEDKNDLLFSPLYNAVIGDVVYLTDKIHVYEYVITSKHVILATDVQIIEDVANETLLTLITCANDGVDRLSVRASFVKIHDFEDMKTTLFQ